MPNNIISWLWWIFTVVIVASLVNLGTTYIKPRLDKFWEKYSTTQKLKNEEREKEENETVSIMLSNSAYAQNKQLFYLELRTRELTYFSLTIISALFGLLLMASFQIADPEVFAFDAAPSSFMLIFHSERLLMECAILIFCFIYSLACGYSMTRVYSKHKSLYETITAYRLRLDERIPSKKNIAK